MRNNHSQTCPQEQAFRLQQGLVTSSAEQVNISLPGTRGHAGDRCDVLKHTHRHHMVPQTGPEQKDNLMMGPKYTQAQSSQGVQRTPGAQLGIQEGHSKERSRAMQRCHHHFYMCTAWPKGSALGPLTFLPLCFRCCSGCVDEYRRRCGP